MGTTSCHLGRGAPLGFCVFAIMTLAPLWAAGAAGAPPGGDAGDVILDDAGPGWKLLDQGLPPLTEQGATHVFYSDSGLLEIYAEPRTNCTSLGISSRSLELAVADQLGFQAQSDTGDGIAHMTGRMVDKDAAAALFSTARFTFLVISSGNDPVDAQSTVDHIVAVQAGADGGTIADTPAKPSRLDTILTDAPANVDLGEPLDVSSNSFACPDSADD